MEESFTLIIFAYFREKEKAIHHKYWVGKGLNYQALSHIQIEIMIIQRVEDYLSHFCISCYPAV